MDVGSAFSLYLHSISNKKFLGAKVSQKRKKKLFSFDVGTTAEASPVGSPPAGCADQSAGARIGKIVYIHFRWGRRWRRRIVKRRGGKENDFRNLITKYDTLPAKWIFFPFSSPFVWWPGHHNRFSSSSSPIDGGVVVVISSFSLYISIYTVCLRV